MRSTFTASAAAGLAGLAAALGPAAPPVNVTAPGSYNASQYNPAINSSMTGPSSSPIPPFSGNPFIKYNISAPGVSASFIPYGARLTNFYVADKNGAMQDLILGYDTGEQYLNDSEHSHTFFGAVVGRYANRIKNGTFEIDGVVSHIPENDNMGNDTLHGGMIGYDQRNWTLIAQTPSSLSFQLYDDALQGFPGSVINIATYTVQVDSKTGKPQFVSRLNSIPLTDATPIMLANHIYWNLGAFIDPTDTTVLNQSLWMPYAERIPAIDNIEIPTGELTAVANGPYDFTAPKTIGRDINETINGCGFNCTGYDTCFINDRPPSAAVDGSDFPLLSLGSPQTGIQMDVYTNQAALQLYVCDGLNGTIPAKSNQQRGNSSVAYEHYGCTVIETEDWIDGINNPQWGRLDYQIFGPSTRAAENYQVYEFSNMTGTLLNAYSS